MNILFVHSIGKNKFGGGEKWLITVAAGLRGNGYNVLVGGRPGSKLLQAARANGLETVALNILSDISLWHVFRIAQILQRHQIDVIITKGSDLLISGLAARFGNNPLVLVRHGSPIRSSFKKHSFLLNKLADGIITNTRTIKEIIEKKCMVREGVTHVIYNGTVAGNNRHSYDFSLKFPGKKIVLSTGRLASSKGYMYMIDAISLLEKKRDDLMFVVLGEGKHYKKFVTYARKKGVSDMIHFEGFVENVVPYLQGCDIFVLPSLYEGMSNAAMEAMSCGKPVVLTNVNGAEELIPDENKGLLIPPKDPEAIALAVERLFGDRQLLRKLGEEGQKHVSENFPVSAMIANIQSCIDEKMLEKNG